MEAIKEYYIYNGKLYSTDNKISLNDSTNKQVYEVIRVINGVALFKEEHIKRMKKSAKLLGYEIKRENDKIFDDISKLIKSNNCSNLNFKIICDNLGSENQNIFMFFIKSSYPEEEKYKNGIDTILYFSERENPNAKVIQGGLREGVNRRLKEENAYEGLLVNGKGHITEGSRSNIFFIKDKVVYTAPKGEVLLGITRSKIIEVCENLGLKVIEKNINVEEISKFDGAIMTGTSVSVLPIRRIGEVKYKNFNNEVINSIKKEYEQMIKEYISVTKS